MRVTTTRMLETLSGTTRPSLTRPQAGRLNMRPGRPWIPRAPTLLRYTWSRPGTHPRGRSDYSLAKEQRKTRWSRTPDKYRMFGIRPATTPACNRLGQLALTRPVNPDHRPRRPGAGGESYRWLAPCQSGSHEDFSNLRAIRNSSSRARRSRTTTTGAPKRRWHATLCLRGFVDANPKEVVANSN